jgi:hypothetical protein
VDGNTMKPTRRRSLAVAVGVLVATALVASPVVLAWRYKANRRAYRRAWKDRAVERIARLSEDAYWIEAQVHAGSAQSPGLAWLREDIIVMADGRWMVYQATGHKEDRRIDDIFIGRASDGKWYYSTYHFCVDMMALPRGDGEMPPPDLDAFINEFNLVEFDGKSDAALEKTWP